MIKRSSFTFFLAQMKKFIAKKGNHKEPTTGERQQALKET
jgi:hypothetical protein